MGPVGDDRALSFDALNLTTPRPVLRTMVDRMAAALA
jgi:hypothetical protein